MDSQKCQTFFEASHNATAEEKESTELRCCPCKHLVTGLENQKRKKTTVETPTTRPSINDSYQKLDYHI